jgi:hypothetical protein
MASEKRFPSDANKKKEDAINPPEPKNEPVKKEVVVEGKKEDIVQVQYSLDNAHVLKGAWSLGKGLNSVSKAVWDSVKDAPSIKKLLADGSAKVVSK